jgi:nucleotide-binding universal stress UspA family protein
MRILCCLDGANSEQLSRAAQLFAGSEAPVYGLLYVTDTEPRREIERTRERFLRRPGELPEARQQQMRQAEHISAQEILAEGLHLLPGAQAIQREGRPEREIVNCAAEWRADVLVILPRTHSGDGLLPGPKSVGHVARFVLDHAPCPVFLVRPLAREHFPLQR